MEGSVFRDFPLDKWQWHPSPIPGQIVYVTTESADGLLDLAPKSWVSMAAFCGPIIGFGCSDKHQTYANVQSTARFTLNFPTFAQASLASEIAAATRSNRLKISGLGSAPSTHGGVPHLEKVPAFMECTLLETVRFEGGEVFLFGRIDRLAVKADIAEQEPNEAYAMLAPAFFLEPGMIGGLTPHSAAAPSP